MRVRFAASCAHAYAEPLVPRLRQLLLLRNLPLAQYFVCRRFGLEPVDLQIPTPTPVTLERRKKILVAVHEANKTKDQPANRWT